MRHDPNREDSFGAIKGIGLTLGAGYHWNAIRSRLDASYEHTHFSYSPGDPSLETGSGNQFTFAIQRLF
jgi:hypothetical protein